MTLLPLKRRVRRHWSRPVGATAPAHVALNERGVPIAPSRSSRRIAASAKKLNGPGTSIATRSGRASEAASIARASSAFIAIRPSQSRGRPARRAAIVTGAWRYGQVAMTTASIAALRAGRHLLCEGRMAMNADEARAMLAASLARPDRVAMLVPGPFSFFADAAIRRLLHEGAIGTPRSFRATWAGAVAPTGRDQWRRDRRFSGNNVMTLGILYESVARWLGQAEEVGAVLENFAPWQAGPDGSPVPADIADHAIVTALS